MASFKLRRTLRTFQGGCSLNPHPGDFPGNYFGPRVRVLKTIPGTSVYCTFCHGLFSDCPAQRTAAYSPRLFLRASRNRARPLPQSGTSPSSYWSPLLSLPGAVKTQWQQTYDIRGPLRLPLHSQMRESARVRLTRGDGSAPLCHPAPLGNLRGHTAVMQRRSHFKRCVCL